MARGRRAGGPDAGGGADDRIVKLTRLLAGVLGEAALTEIEVESGDVRVRVQRAHALPASVHAGPTAGVGGATAPATSPHPVVADVTPVTAITIEAPMVGTFYRASSPSAEPYVKEGDVVKAGQILCIIEAMKLMNEIESKVSGRVAKIAVDNGQAVEYGQPLFLIDPQS
ncbi:MAG TPA: acetyl-CoA carboxylase biotin carboxyl carrier protein [Candidatus Limnocylindria bacterium]|nr:acetyl-CoA carboxylase biotin carboxyl carrier protein [Candidatus Limnocylindria bacterium]